VSLQRAVAGRVVWHAVLPAAPQDAGPDHAVADGSLPLCSSVGGKEKAAPVAVRRLTCLAFVEPPMNAMDRGKAEQWRIDIRA
jgi:hypothetical protein